jgi:biopolymer transport protein ExbB
MINTIIDTWQTGGWVMIPLAILAIISYTSCAYLLLTIKIKNIISASDKDISMWVKEPNRSPKEVRYIFEYIENSKNVDDKCKEIELYMTEKINKHFTIMIVLISCAPLLGLLGTVSGMISTFKGISAGGSASTIISKGISECLIATQTGLIVAVPGMIASYWIRSRKNELISFLLRVESVALREVFCDKIYK